MALAGQRYQLEAAQDLLKPFELLQEVAAQPQEGPSQVSVSVDLGARFFRVRGSE